MSNKQKFIIAGSGALAPQLVNLAVIDLQSIATFGITFLFIASYVIRQIVLFGIGGTVGCLNQEENPWKLFQIGIAAPALLTALINAKQVGTMQVPTPLPPAPGSPVSLLESIAVPDVLADETAPDGTMIYSLPEETATQQISRGMFGSAPTNVWYVIAAAFSSKANAQAAAATMRQKGFPAQVYNPHSNEPYYTVVIGAQLTHDEAQRVKQEAINKGLGSDARLWTFPPN